jgi:hypothetical protein
METIVRNAKPSLTERVEIMVRAIVNLTVAACDLKKGDKGKGKGRPIKRNPVAIITEHIRPLAAAQALIDEDPLAGYVAMAKLRRDLTPEERDQVAATDEARFQGILPCGDPAQAELFFQTAIRVTEDDTNGDAFRREVRRALKMARVAVQDEANERRANGNTTPVTMFLRYQPNIVTRKVRNSQGKMVNANAGIAQAALFRAKYGGRLYGSDVAEKAGILLAVITPAAGERTALASYEWAVPGFN